MKISIVGTGYVGLVSGACFADLGNHVTCIDINKKKINDIKNLKLPFYLPWLFLEIIKSNLHVAWCIITGRIQPQTLKLKVNQKTATGIAIHANSITLTPGTISVDIEHDQLLVHALTDTTAASAKTGAMDAQVCRLEGRG